MAQYIKQGDIFGRIGSGIGKGLAEQLPEEVTRGRLAAGLKNLSEQKGLTPFQQFAGLISQPGMTPQGVQTGGQLLQQQAYLDALKNQYEGQGGPKTGSGGYVPSQDELKRPVKGELPTLATEEDTAQSYKSFIPPTEQEERADAFENFKANPARYQYNFDNALNERKAITKRNQEIQGAHQTQETTAVGKEEKVKDALKSEITKLKLNSIPPKSYQRFEEKILKAILSKKEGGEGLTQEQAIKKYSKDLDQANRDYEDLGSLSRWSPLDFNRRVNAMQKTFASRGEQQQMMDQMISDYGIAPIYAAHRAYPIKKGELPTINKIAKQPVTAESAGVPVPRLHDITYEQIKNEMGKKHSPLSIAYELQQLGHDPREWLNFLNNHRDNLEVWQADQLNKNINVFDLKDMWLRAWE